MKKILMIVTLTLMVPSFAFALTLGNDSLQNALNGITEGGLSSVNVETDNLGDNIDSYWNPTASGNSGFTLMFELAIYANDNTFGIFDRNDIDNKVELFDGSVSPGDIPTSKVGVEFYDVNGDMEIYISNTLVGTFATNTFGFYLESPDLGGKVFYSDTSLNNDGADHMLAYQGTGDKVKVENTFQGTWTADTYVLAFEDLTNTIIDGLQHSDNDFSDFVVMVESVEPVPEPGTMVLLGFGLIGLAAFGRKKGILQK